MNHENAHKLGKQQFCAGGLQNMEVLQQRCERFGLIFYFFENVWQSVVILNFMLSVN